MKASHFLVRQESGKEVSALAGLRPSFRFQRNDGREPGKGRVCERDPKMSAANFGREATHAQRVTGLPGFAEGEMGGASRTRAETSLLLS